MTTPGPSAAEAAAGTPEESERHAFSDGYVRYAMCVLLGLYLVSNLDRQVVNILAEPIKHDLALADW